MIRIKVPTDSTKLSHNFGTRLGAARQISPEGTVRRAMPPSSPQRCRR